MTTVLASTCFTVASDLRVGDVATYHNPDGSSVTFEVSRLLPTASCAYVWFETTTPGLNIQCLAGTSFEILLDVLVTD